MTLAHSFVQRPSRHRRTLPGASQARTARRFSTMLSLSLRGPGEAVKVSATSGLKAEQCDDWRLNSCCRRSGACPRPIEPSLATTAMPESTAASVAPTPTTQDQGPHPPPAGVSADPHQSNVHLWPVLSRHWLQHCLRLVSDTSVLDRFKVHPRSAGGWPDAKIGPNCGRTEAPMPTRVFCPGQPADMTSHNSSDMKSSIFGLMLTE